MTEYDRPLPAPDKFTKFHWEAAKKHQVAIAKCTKCGQLNHWPKSNCRYCQNDTLAPSVVSGKGKIYSYHITHYPYDQAFLKNGPYNVILVELDEDPRVRMISNLVHHKPEQLKIGAPVEAVFEDVTPELTLIKFQPRAGGN